MPGKLSSFMWPVGMSMGQPQGCVGVLRTALKGRAQLRSAASQSSAALARATQACSLPASSGGAHGMRRGCKEDH